MHNIRLNLMYLSFVVQYISLIKYFGLKNVKVPLYTRLTLLLHTSAELYYIFVVFVARAYRISCKKIK